MGQKRFRQKLAISIHALLAESDNRRPIFFQQAEKFLSTLSLRRATQTQSLKISPLRISIHALLAESDKTLEIGENLINNFYPRSPCGERREGE